MKNSKAKKITMIFGKKIIINFISITRVKDFGMLDKSFLISSIR